MGEPKPPPPLWGPPMRRPTKGEKGPGAVERLDLDLEGTKVQPAAPVHRYLEGGVKWGPAQ